MEWADKPLLSRAEIVEAYEEKIDAGARSKLSKGNKLGLIHWFIKRLNECEAIAPSSPVKRHQAKSYQ